MPQKLPEHDMHAAEAAIEYAQSVRSLHARRTERGNRQREADIQLALDRLKSAMTPLRKEIGRFPYGPQNSIADANRAAIKEASAQIQRERRKLWKMQK